MQNFAFIVKVGLILLIQSLETLKSSSLVNKLLQKSPIIKIQNEIWSRKMPMKPMFATYGNFSLSLSRILHVPTPSYVQILKRGILSVTSFSLLRKGSIMQFNLQDSTSIQDLRGEYLWPNELTLFQDRAGIPIMLVPDGFLTPGQSDGGLYAIANPSSTDAQPVRMTSSKPGWFYHRAIYIKLPGGSEGVLTARATKPLFGRGQGELVWLSIPKTSNINNVVSENREIIAPANQAKYDKNAGSSEGARDRDDRFSEEKGIDLTRPWNETILASGPDVMFEVTDIDKEDDSVEVISAHFFDKKVTVLSLRAVPHAPFVEVSEVASLDTVGRPYGLCLANMAPDLVPPPLQANSEGSIDDDVVDIKQSHSSAFKRSSISCDGDTVITSPSSPPVDRDLSLCDNSNPTHILVSTHECSYDFPAAFSMAVGALTGKFPIVKRGRSNFPESPGSRTEGLEEIPANEDWGRILLRDGEQQAVESGAFASRSGGALFAYDIPKKISITKDLSAGNELKSKETPLLDIPSSFPTSGEHLNKLPAERDVMTELPSVSTSSHGSKGLPAQRNPSMGWNRHTLFRGFKVRGWGGIFSPGAPGFPYVFRLPHKPQSPPLILLAGDCTGSAYIFSPTTSNSQYLESESKFSGISDSPDERPAPLPDYELAFEIECGATVGSAAVSTIPGDSGDVEVFIPSYELNKIHAFRFKENG